MGVEVEGERKKIRQEEKSKCQRREGEKEEGESSYGKKGKVERGMSEKNLGWLWHITNCRESRK